jgi:hypothetical protein
VSESPRAGTYAWVAASSDGTVGELDAWGAASLGVAFTFSASTAGGCPGGFVLAIVVAVVVVEAATAEVVDTLAAGGWSTAGGVGLAGAGVVGLVGLAGAGGGVGRGGCVVGVPGAVVVVVEGAGAVVVVVVDGSGTVVVVVGSGAVVVVVASGAVVVVGHCHSRGHASASTRAGQARSTTSTPSPDTAKPQRRSPLVSVIADISCDGPGRRCAPPDRPPHCVL